MKRIVIKIIVIERCDVILIPVDLCIDNLVMINFRMLQDLLEYTVLFNSQYIFQQVVCTGLCYAMDGRNKQYKN